MDFRARNLAVIFLLCLVFLAPASEGLSYQKDMAFKYEDGLVTIHGTDISLPLLLEELAASADVQIVLLGPLSSTSVGADFSCLPIEEALGRILKGCNYAVLYFPLKYGAGKRVQSMETEGRSKTGHSKLALSQRSPSPSKESAPMRASPSNASPRVSSAQAETEGKRWGTRRDKTEFNGTDPGARSMESADPAGPSEKKDAGANSAFSSDPGFAVYGIGEPQREFSSEPPESSSESEGEKGGSQSEGKEKSDTSSAGGEQSQVDEGSRNISIEDIIKRLERRIEIGKSEEHYRRLLETYTRIQAERSL